MNCCSKDRSTLDLAQSFFDLIKPADSDLGESNDDRLAQNGFDEAKFKDEIRYLRAFAVHYSTCETLGESPEGNGLRTAFMRIWDKASRTSAASMDSYNEFFKRIQLYASLVSTDSSIPRAQATDRIPGKFAELLGGNLDSSSRAHFATCAAVHFNSTCTVVAEALKKRK